MWQLMEEYGTAILRLCLMMLGDEPTAHRAAQRAFMLAARQSNTPALTQIARAALRACRRYAPQAALLRFVRARSSFVSGEEANPLCDAVALLPRRERAAVLLHDYLELTLPQTAAALHVSRRRASRLLRRGHSRMA